MMTMKSMGLTQIVSTDIIRPSSRTHHLKPFKLSFLDQVTPSTYSPILFFYPSSNANRESMTRLKTSLSETLSHLYPLSGRVKDNLFVTDYEEGVPFIENRVNCRLFEYLQEPRLELLNELLPLQPYSYVTNPEMVPNVAVKVSVFDCGGLAIGGCCNHKFMDGITSRTFFLCWAAMSRGSSCHRDFINPDNFNASLRFKPLDSSFQSYFPFENRWFTNSTKNVMRRYVFYANAVATMRQNARSENVPNPTRVEALSCFIWQSAMRASRFISSSSNKQSLATHAVNIRPKTVPRMPICSFGNLLRTAIVIANANDTKVELKDLVALTRDALSRINVDYLSSVEQNCDRFQAISNLLLKLDEMKETVEKPDKYSFTNWMKFGIEDVDFGWGKPVWTGIMGEAGPRFHNCIILKETVKKDGVEAWMTLDEKTMAVIEQDPEFLSYATPNPSVISPTSHI